MNMTEGQFSFYFDRLKLYRNNSQIAALVGVARPTVDRWEQRQGLPDVRYFEKLDEAWNEVIDWVRAKGFDEIADVHDQEERPRASDYQKSRRGPEFNKRWLTNQLSKSKRPVRYSVLMDRAVEIGMTRSQLQYAALLLNVKKKTVRKGREAESLWSLT